METPSSTRIITRSQARAQAPATLNNSTNNKNDNNDSNLPFSRKLASESECAFSKSRTRNSKQQEQDRSVLFDITNDSPIIGLATESSETPYSAIGKQKRNRAKAALTPGSGEDLLRGQVKTLLQKVEEEADRDSKIFMECRPFLHLKGLVSSPMGLLAPTPANTPQISNLFESGDEVNSNGMASITPLPVIEEQLKICQVVADIFNGSNPESLESQKSINRSLLFDFSEKSEITDSSDCSSVVTNQGVQEGGGSVCKDKSSLDDDNASVWSIQVNASSTRDEEEEEMIEQEEDDEFYYHDDNEEEEEEEEVQEAGEDGGLLDALCEGISKINVTDKFSGKHTRFVYNSDDDEIVEKYEEDSSAGVSPSVLRLKGLPTPKGKHLRFPIEGDDN